MHDLWIFPTPRSSRWFARMDWYLNWQMCKGLAYPGLHLPQETLRVASDHGHGVDAPVPAGGPLLVLPGARVPAAKCLVMDDVEEAFPAWLKRVAAQAARLKAHTARVYLPSGRTVREAESAWANLKSPLDVTFAPDLETTT